MNGKLISLNIGMPVESEYQRKLVKSGIHKQSIDLPVYLGWTNLDGDGQADLVHHGGRDKAVCVYPFEHYAYWESWLERKLAFGAFGENFTTQGILEEDICVGDIYEIGNALVQVSQPRQPCFKLSMKYGVPALPQEVLNTGYTGFYFRVLREGKVASGQELKLVERHPLGVTVNYANHVMHREKADRAGAELLLAVAELSGSWRETFTKRVAEMDR